MDTLRHDVRSKDGTLIPVWISGSGRPLIVVHGAVSDHTAFDLLRAELDAQVTFAAIDRRGTFCDPLGRHDLEREFEDISAVAESLGPEVDLFGHSGGAVCALGAALRVTNLRHLVVYEPPMRNKPNWPAMALRMDAFQAAGDVDAVFETWLQSETGMPASAAKKVKNTEVGADLFRWAHTLPREMTALAGWTVDAGEFASLRSAMLYLIGSETPEDRHVYLGLLKNVIPNFTLREIQGQGHMAHLLAPKALAEIIAEFVQS